MHPLFDAHSHLPEGAPRPPAQVQVVCATREADWEAVLARARQHTGTIPMLGLHPWFSGEAGDGWAARLEARLRSSRAGLGECGLDYARSQPDREQQLGAFRTQLRLARTLRRPVAIHAVRCWADLLAVLRDEGPPAAGALVHAYSGSAETARSLQDLGLFLSFSGSILDPARTRARAALAQADGDRLLLETDGAAELPAILAQAAALRGVSPEDLARQTWENGQRCFKELIG